MKKILVLTDSLGLSRNSNGNLVRYEKTWVNLLKADFIIHQVSIGGATITDIVNQMDYHSQFQPDIVIVQSGIVDCAPRAFTKTERMIFSAVPLVNKLFNKISANYGRQIRNFRQKTYTPPRIFEGSINKIRDFFFPVPVYFLGIVPAMEDYEKQVKGIKNKIDLYNNIIKKSANYISLEEITIDRLMPDWHHLNESGNEYVYRKILQEINLTNVK
ncbi:MAG TPA: SGNH/GDSL hydrolase family protein [Chitinophagaceae bacterium]|nr:SGNH/GDSL hydrolase family protein [Chitinophagaceae bacterium]